MDHDETQSTQSQSGPRLDEQAMRRRTGVLIRIVAAVIATAWIALLTWIFFVAPIYKAPTRPLTTGVDLGVTLAPTLILASFNELIVARVFDMLELLWPAFVAYFGYGMIWLKVAEREVHIARRWLQSASELYNGTLAAYDREANAAIASARLQLQEAEQRLEDVVHKLKRLTDAPGYIQAKKLFATVLSLLLGVLWAGLGSFQLFALLGVEVPARIDVLLTGLIIGSIQTPVSSTKDVFQTLADAIATFFYNRSVPMAMPAEQTITSLPVAFSGPSGGAVSNETVDRS